MSVVRLNVTKISKLKNFTRFCSTQIIESEYTDTPQYPPILDLSYEKVKERKREDKVKIIKAVKTVEEKQIKLNMPKYYGFKCYMLLEDRIPYDNFQLAQHITRTHLIEQNTLPLFYNSINVEPLLSSVKSNIEDIILSEYDGNLHHELHNGNLENCEKDNIISKAISKQINREIINKLCNNFTHLKNVQVDFEPRIECAWFAGGMNPPENIKRYRKGEEWRKHTENDPTDRAIQYIGAPNLTVRSQMPLQPLLQQNEIENPAFEVPYFEYDPRVVGTTTAYRRLVNTPGFWPGDPHSFGLLSYHQRGHIINRQFYNDVQENLEAIHRQGIIASFGWLNAQANFLGFNTFNDITYPLATQTIITNGQYWSFYIYQLNTMLMHTDNSKNNPKRNICWATPELKLFESIENGKVVGFNDDVLKMLLQLYCNVPKERVGIELRPYLSKEEKLIAHYEDIDKRKWLEQEYKFIVSNRPRMKLDYEVYAWEKIYKIDNKTRPMDKRTRPFELFYKPWNRTYDNRQARYIPRKFRPDVPRWKNRYAKEYFP